MAELTLLYGRNLWGASPGAVLRLASSEIPARAKIRAKWVEALETYPGAGLDDFEFDDESEAAAFGHLAALVYERSGQGATSATTERDGERVAIYLPSRETAYAYECLKRTFEWLSERDPRPLREIIEALDVHRDDTCLGPSTLSIVDAATARGIPSLRLSPVDSLVQLGWGVKSRRIWAAETDKSRAIPNEIAQDKDLTRRILRALGIAVPDGASVSSAEEAWAVAERVGLPVVVKPQTGSKGRGVSIELETRSSVEAAYEVAAKFAQGVVVERYVRGVHHRVLVVAEKVVAASRASEEVVFGDGRSTISELVQRANEDPKRMHGHASILTRLELDAIALELLERRGLTPESVPKVGEKIFIHLNGDLTTDVTDLVHPEVAMVCVEAAKAIGLEVTGVDLLVEDIARPLDEQGGVVVELNARPGLLMHLDPVEGTPRDVGTPILETMFALGEDGRVPTVLLSGGTLRRATALALEKLLSPLFPGLGTATHRGIVACGRTVSRAPSDVAEGVMRLVMHRGVDVLVAERSPEGIFREGLFLDRAKVALLSDVEFESAELAKSAALVLEGASHVVLPSEAKEVSSRSARSIFGPSGHSRLMNHAAGGGRVAYAEDGAIVLREGASLHRVRLPRGALTLGPEDAFCAAALVAWALGVSPARILEILTNSEHWA